VSEVAFAKQLLRLATRLSIAHRGTRIVDEEKDCAHKRRNEINEAKRVAEAEKKVKQSWECRGCCYPARSCRICDRNINAGITFIISLDS